MSHRCLLLTDNHALESALIDTIGGPVDEMTLTRVASQQEAMEQLSKLNVNTLFIDSKTVSAGERFHLLAHNISINTKIIFFQPPEDQQEELSFWSIDYYDKIEGIYQNITTLKSKLEKMAFSARQIKVLLMIAKGEGNKAIAKNLKISEQGVKYHVGIFLKIFQKRNRKELQKTLNGLSGN